MVIFLLFVIVIALIIQELSCVNAAKHDNILYSCKPSVPCCEPGEEFRVYSTVTNTSKFPSPVIRIEERFPQRLQISHISNLKTHGDDEHRIFVSTVSMRGKQRVRRYLSASILERGEYHFSFAEFHAGDFMGFHENSYFRDNDEVIVIFPAPIENADFMETFTDAFDSIALRKRLLEDPISVCGYREYTGREPMRSISWKQTAVRNQIIVKEFDPTWQQAVTVVLDMQYHGEYDLHFKRQEYCFSIARTICDYLEDKLFEYRIVTNAIITDGISNFYSPGGRGAAYNKILYALGSAKNGGTCSVGELISNACSGAYREKTIVFISTRRDDAVNKALALAKNEKGTDVITIFAEDYVFEEVTMEDIANE